MKRNYYQNGQKNQLKKVSSFFGFFLLVLVLLSTITCKGTYDSFPPVTDEPNDPPTKTDKPSGTSSGPNGNKPSGNPSIPKTDRDILLEWIFTNENVDYSSLSDIERVRHIRNFLLQKLPHGFDDFYDLPYMEVLELNLQHKRGVLCGGSSYLFAKICNEFGLDAVSINLGYLETTDTHVMTIIRITHNDKTILTLFDALTGLEFFDANGDIANFKEIVQAENNNDNNFNYSLYLVDGQKLSFSVKELLDPTEESPISIDPYTGKPCVYYEMNVWQNKMLVKLENANEKHGYMKSVFPFLLHPIGIGIESIDIFLDLIDFYEFEIGIPWYSLVNVQWN